MAWTAGEVRVKAAGEAEGKVVEAAQIAERKAERKGGQAAEVKVEGEEACLGVELGWKVEV